VLPFRELRYHCTISVTVSDFCIFYNYAMQHMHFTLNIYLIFRDNASFSIWLLEVLVPIHRIHIVYSLLVIFHFATNRFRQTFHRFVYPFVFTRLRASSAFASSKNHVTNRRRQLILSKIGVLRFWQRLCKVLSTYVYAIPLTTNNNRR